ncbi:hypothetical protein QCM80_16015 [Bradyrhizobium sp. SSUT112]|uniref:hypothetical protein n=1 Tax=Bradyrhizobium sp. SSUT112 TaxID=3040604 RepID=UPI00244A8152|nr:hypothetical protein [Bradyrhizobium sp. SSUT112]MDH2352160.1 hypothetical protein [Bradyrhizobium sp. SSUT112]
MSDENPEKDASSEKLTGGFLEGLYGDPLRTETMRTGRHLIIASAVCAAVVLFKVRLQSTSLIPLDFGDRVDVLPMLLSLAVVLLLVSFALRAATDLLRERETTKLVVEYVEAERVKAALLEARETDAEIAESQREDHEGPSGEPDPWWEPYIEVKEAADAAVLKAEKRLGVRRLPRELRQTRKILEVGVPIVFAVVAIVLSRSSMHTFGSALISAFAP